MAKPSTAEQYLARGSMSDSHDDSASASDHEEDESLSRESTSHNNDNSSTNTGSTPRNDDGLSNEEEIKQLSARETQTIRCWRIIVLALILSVGAGVAGGAFYFLRKQQETTYREGFASFAASVRDSSTFYVKNLHLATRGLSESITEYAQARNQTFPFVTVSIFETLGRHVREQSGIESLVYSPIVRDRDRLEWESYSVDNQGWVDMSIEQYKASSELVSSKEVTYGEMDPIFPEIFSFTNKQETLRMPAETANSYAPYWHVSPFPSTSYFINSNQLDTTYFDESVFNAASIAREGVYTQKVDISALAKDKFFGTQTHVQYHEQFLVNQLDVATALETPHAYLVEPVFAEVDDPTALVVAYLQALVPFDRFLWNVLPDGVSGVYVVLQNNCGDIDTYVLNGNKATYLGPGDLHDPEYDYSAVKIPLFQYLNPSLTSILAGHCSYSFICYSSEEYASSVKTNLPSIVIAAVCAIFAFVALTFIFYDRFVQRRNNIVLSAATKSHAILSSLFPSNIRDRLYAERAEAEKTGGSNNLKSLLADDHMAGLAEEDEEMGYKGKPIADLFAESTVLFADIAGFTAWSSQREPAQVFTLLETLYRAFDEIARKRRVFKVETVGDCYVAVTGVPEVQKDHVVIMCRFARDMLSKCHVLTKKLETKLGPDTGELDMRVGIHSGPVTAGVLRGERSRFQLFGDTMNTASRTESTGSRGKIQLTQETADILVAVGKGHWVSQREDKVIAKGKGEMTTYWLSIKKETSYAASSAGSSDSGTEDLGNASETSTHQPKPFSVTTEKTTRLVEWNCEVMLRIIKEMQASRKAGGGGQLKSLAVDENKYMQSNTLVIDEVQEIIHLPEFDHRNNSVCDPESVVVSTEVVDQLFDYVSNIAAMYRPNFFHSFEHGSHVTMSVSKLLSRIIAPTNVEGSGRTLHDHSFGITSDYLTQFSCIFSALIHDVDHTGAPNAQLIKEQTAVADYYKGKSVAEQNSVDIAWHLLMDDNYADLRAAIYTTDDELRRFRQLVVNSVMATDIVDKDLKVLRNERWEKAFSETAAVESEKDAIDRKATIVIEHLIQASDVSHTMQHWHIYRKWNERFFFECYKAYKDGRAEFDPSESWYAGELGFFDFYIIPLAKKLKDCGVFGVSSDEYLNYAQRNRMEWEERGEEVVQEMIEKAHREIHAADGLVFL